MRTVAMPLLSLSYDPSTFVVDALKMRDDVAYVRKP
jgi:hypothetical protein